MAFLGWKAAAFTPQTLRHVNSIVQLRLYRARCHGLFRLCVFDGRWNASRRRCYSLASVAQVGRDSAFCASRDQSSRDTSNACLMAWFISIVFKLGLPFFSDGVNLAFSFAQYLVQPAGGFGFSRKTRGVISFPWWQIHIGGLSRSVFALLKCHSVGWLSSVMISFAGSCLLVTLKSRMLLHYLHIFLKMFLSVMDHWKTLGFFVFLFWFFAIYSGRRREKKSSGKGDSKGREQTAPGLQFVWPTSVGHRHLNTLKSLLGGIMALKLWQRIIPMWILILPLTMKQCILTDSH